MVDMDVKVDGLVDCCLKIVDLAAEIKEDVDLGNVFPNTVSLIEGKKVKTSFV